MRAVVAGPLLVAAAALACAQPQSPPGGEPDRSPPRVVSVRPEPFDTLRDLRAPVVIRFDERISERLQEVRDLRDAVLVSPATGDVRVERGRRALEISIAGGWRPGLVYRVVVLPVFRDLFGNQRVEPIELVFSTGAPIPETAVAGLVADRLAGDPVAGARVEAVHQGEQIRYLAVTDTSGFFSLRNIPAGTYDLRAWLDRNRDRAPDFQEPQDSASLRLGEQDTAVVELALLPMDTTPARLLRAEAVDSLRVRLHFDDYFPPGPVDGRAVVYRLDDSVRVSGGTLIHSTALDTLLARERAVADSIRAARQDTAGAEPAEALAPDRPRRMPADSPRVRPRAAAPGAATRALPSQQLALVLAVPLNPGVSYYVDVEGVMNISGVPGGGGTARFEAPAPAEPAPAGPPGMPPDTAGR